MIVNGNNCYTIDREFFANKNLTTFSDENQACEIFCATYINLYLFWSLKSGNEIFRLCEKFTLGEIFYWRKSRSTVLYTARILMIM